MQSDPSILTNKGSRLAWPAVLVAVILFFFLSQFGDSLPPTTKQTLAGLLFLLGGSALGWMAGEVMAHAPAQSVSLAAITSFLASILVVRTAWEKVKEQFPGLDLSTFLSKLLSPASDPSLGQPLNWGFLGLLLAAVAGYLYEKTKAS